MAAPCLLSAALLGGCATLDITHPDEATKWAAGGSAFEGAAYLTVYDNELKQLAAQAQAEDASLAQRLVACRNADVATVVDHLSPEFSLDCRPVAGSTGGATYLEALVARTLADDVGAAYDIDRLSGLKFGMDHADNDLSIAQFLLDNARQAYAKAHPAPKPPASAKTTPAGAPSAAAPKPFDTSCEALAKIDAATADAAGAGGIKTRCGLLATVQLNTGLSLLVYLRGKTPPPGPLDCAKGLGDAGPRLLSAYCAGWAPTKTSTAGASDAAGALAAKLQAEVDAATTANTAAQDQLATFGKDLESGISSLPTGVAKVDALNHLSEIVDAISRADICNEPKQFDAATVTAAKCDPATATPLQTQASDTWAFMNALAMLADANNANARSAQWLAAAQAIIAAQKANAKLEADQEAAEVAAAQAEFRALVVEVTQDAQVLQYLHRPPELPCAGAPTNCALPLWVDAVNRGSIPAALASGHPDQIQREYAVRRERVVADRRGQLLVAAASAEDAGVKAGIDPTKLVTLLFDIAAVAAVASR